MEREVALAIGNKPARLEYPSQLFQRLNRLRDMEKHLAHPNDIERLVPIRQTLEHIADRKVDVLGCASFLLFCELFCLGNDFRCKIDASDGTLRNMFCKSRGDGAGAATHVQDVEVGFEAWEKKSSFIVGRTCGMGGCDRGMPALLCAGSVSGVAVDVFQFEVSTYDRASVGRPSTSYRSSICVA